MPYTSGSMRRRDAALQERFDPWARELLEVLKADPWNWHARAVDTPAASMLLGTDDGGLSRYERAAQRSLWWNLGHAPSSGLRTRPEWSLQVAWGPAVYLEAPPGRLLRPRRRVLTARVTPKQAGQRSVLVRGRRSYIASPTSRGALAGED